MITKHKLYYDSPWTALRFEKRGVTLLYNDRTKEYDFYKHASKPKPKAKAVDLEKEYFKLTPLMIAVLVLSGALGISVAYNIVNVIF